MIEDPVPTGIVTPRRAQDVTPGDGAGQAAAGKDDTGNGEPQIKEPDPQKESNKGTSYEGSITVKIGTTPFTLEGSLHPDGIVVDYHATFADAFTIGSIREVARQLALTIGDAAVGDAVVTAFNEVSGMPIVGPFFDLLTSASIKLTDLAFDSRKGSYQFGLAFDFQDVKPEPTMFGISLISLGFKATHPGTPKKPDGTPDTPSGKAVGPAGGPATPGKA
jgi:hypothetical protein